MTALPGTTPSFGLPIHALIFILIPNLQSIATDRSSTGKPLLFSSHVTKKRLIPSLTRFTPELFWHHLALKT